MGFRIARILSLLLVLIVAAGQFNSSHVFAADDITNLVLSKNELVLEVGSTTNITSTAIFTSGTTENVTVKTDWNSGSADVASVYAGAVTGKKEGTAVITATYLAKTVIVNVTVTKKVKSLTKDKQLINLRFNQSEAVVVTAYYDDGTTEDVSNKADWTSSNDSIATVTNGLVKGLASGSTTITAKYNNQSLSLPVNVEIIKRIDAVKPEISLLLHGSEKMKLMATYPDGTVEDVAEKAEWTTDKENVADVLKGTVTGYGPGQATLTATYGTKSATIKVDVDNAVKLDMNKQNLFMKKNGTEQLTLTATYANGSTDNTIAERAEWSSSDENIVYVFKGKLTANAIGQATITAKFGEKEITTIVDVDVPRRLEANEETFVMKTGDTADITLYATYADPTVEKEIVTDRAKWVVDNTTAIDVLKGKITAYKPGEATVTASYGGKNVVIKVQVDIPSVITPSSKTVNLAIGANEQIKLIPTGMDGVAGADVASKAEWVSSSPTIVDVNKGLITGLATGAAVVTAKYGTRTVTIQVSVGVLDTLTTTASSMVLKKGESQKIDVTAKYKDGTTKEVSSDVVWTSSNGKAATVESGKITAIGSGETTITATLDSKSVSVTVSVDTADALTASSMYLVFDLGEIKQITVTATDPLDVEKDVTTEAEWKSSNAQIVQVAKGTVTPVTRGKATLTATYGGKSVTISVEIGVVSELRVDQRFISMKAGSSMTVQLTAVLSDGSTRDVTSAASWKTSSYKVADVANGTITAMGPGKTTVTGTFGGKAIGLPIDVDTLKYLKTDVVKLELKAGQDVQITATGTYTDGSDENVTVPAMWVSSNIQVVDVKDGIVKATGKGKARVTVTYSNIKTYVVVTVQ
jgi:hypothetical protein